MNEKLKQTLIEFQNNLDHYASKIKEYEKNIEDCEENRKFIIFNFLKQQHDLYEGGKYTTKENKVFEITKIEIKSFHLDYICLSMYGNPYKKDGEVSKKQQWLEFYHLYYSRGND